MNVLIVGGTRNVGLLLAWRLLAAGHRVTHFNRGTRPDPFGSRIARIVASFLANPPAAPPFSYAERGLELSLADRLCVR